MMPASWKSWALAAAVVGGYVALAASGPIVPKAIAAATGALVGGLFPLFGAGWMFGLSQLLGARASIAKKDRLANTLWLIGWLVAGAIFLSIWAQPFDFARALDRVAPNG